MRSFKDWLLEQMRAFDMSAVEMAKKIGIDQSLVSRYLKGERVPSRQTAKKIAEAFNVPYIELLEMIDAQDRANANHQGVPDDVNAAGAPRGFGDMVWERLSPEARGRIIEIVRIEMEEAE